MRIIIQICMKAKHRSMHNMVTIGNKRTASIQFICNCRLYGGPVTCLLVPYNCILQHLPRRLYIFKAYIFSICSQYLLQ